MKLPDARSRSCGGQDGAQATTKYRGRVVLVCGKCPEQGFLEACLAGYKVATVTSLKDAVKALAKGTPDVVVILATTKEPMALEVLHLLRRSQIQAPTIMVLPHPCHALESQAFQLGVRQFIHAPIRYEDMRKALDSVLKSADGTQRSTEPPICDFEARQNLSTLVETLSKQMKCAAGANRVFLHSVVQGIGKKTKPRVCLRCPVRHSLGLSEYVFFEHIRDYCVSNYEACDAMIQHNQLRQVRG